MDSRHYYEIAKAASRQIGRHTGLRYLKQVCAKADKILDLGCGEGTRLDVMVPDKPGWGVDIDTFAITQAKRQYPHHHFQTYDGRWLPFSDNYFDLVYSAFVLEHTADPERFLQEAIRALKPNGQLVLICPNFGAPSRRSPNSTETPWRKLVTGFILDFVRRSPSSLHWRKVVPKNTYDQIDDDTTVEPYLPTLLAWLQSQHLGILASSTLWHLEPLTFNPRKVLFLVLGRLNFYPFRNWGPQLFVAARKL